MLPDDFCEFAIELRFEPAANWIWAVVDTDGATLQSGCSSSQSAAWGMATKAVEALVQLRDLSDLH
ncbi:hypothetical protein D3C87_1084700 [compost metagenome]|jgi:hypothetical protein|nr:hypothetical protein [Brevundimonas sp.]